MTTVIETRDNHFRCPCHTLWVWSAGGAYRPGGVWAEESVLGNYICDTCGQQFLIHPVGQPVPAHPRER